MSSIKQEKLVISLEIEEKLLPFYSYLKEYVKDHKHQNFEPLDWIFFIHLIKSVGYGYVYINKISFLNKAIRNIGIIEKYKNGMSVKQIAEGCDIGERQIRKIIHDGYRYLSKSDEENLFETQYITIKF